MKKLIEVEEKTGLESLMGEHVTLFCMNYIYTGKLTGVNTDQVLLEEPAIVFETGAFTCAQWKDAQALPHELYIRLSAVESYGKVK